MYTIRLASGAWLHVGNRDINRSLADKLITFEKA